MGNTCKPMADSFQCMTKPTTIKKKEDIEMAKKPMKGYSTSLIIREMQITAVRGYYLTLLRMVIIKKSINNKCWRRCGKRETSYIVDGNIN